jgi:hypothetical protein
MGMSKRTRFDESLAARKIEQVSIERSSRVLPLGPDVVKSLADIGMHVIQVSQGRILVELQTQDYEMNDDLIKTVLPVFRELAMTQQVIPFPSAPDADEIKLREAIAEAKAVIQKRAQQP